MNYYEFFLEKPKQAIISLLVCVFAVIIAFIIMKYYEGERKMSRYLLVSPQVTTFCNHLFLFLFLYLHR